MDYLWIAKSSFGNMLTVNIKDMPTTSGILCFFRVDMESIREWSQSVEGILIFGCGLHEPFTMGRSDGCEGYLDYAPPPFSTLI